MTIRLGAAPLTTRDILAIARNGVAVALDDAALQRIEAGYRALEALAAGGAAIYGVSTGLGAGVDTRITPDPVLVQRRIPPGRAVGVGREARADEVRAIIAARLAGLCAGRSGASRPVAEALAALLNRNVHPVVPMTGSVGEADLAPLSHGRAACHTGAGLPLHRGHDRPSNRLDAAAKSADARQALLRLFRARCHARTAPRTHRVVGQVQGPLRRGLGQP
jgi:histidine ammonia-lyase